MAGVEAAGERGRRDATFAEETRLQFTENPLIWIGKHIQAQNTLTQSPKPSPQVNTHTSPHVRTEAEETGDPGSPAAHLPAARLLGFSSMFTWDSNQKPNFWLPSLTCKLTSDGQLLDLLRASQLVKFLMIMGTREDGAEIPAAMNMVGEENIELAHSNDTFDVEGREAGKNARGDGKDESATGHPHDKAMDIERVEADICAVHERERDILLKKFGSIPGRMSLIARSWANRSHTSGYVAFTAQLIDSEWKLHRRMLNFMVVPRPCSDKAAMEAIGKSLSEWNLKKKLFTITVDNDFWSHDFYTVNMRDRQSKMNTVMLGGQIYVVRCYAHTLTEVAHGVIDSIQSAIYKIHESIKFIKSCCSHEEKFSYLARELKIVTDQTLCLDIRTQWNTTYLMLQAALDYKKVLTMLDAFDDNYNKMPLAEDWRKIDIACMYLEQLYASEHSIMSEDPTANIFFHEVGYYNESFQSPRLMKN
nr:unnamed protein product [Digitaria exilis]